jgi:short chain dehydrogenase
MIMSKVVVAVSLLLAATLLLVAHTTLAFTFTPYSARLGLFPPRAAFVQTATPIKTLQRYYKASPASSLSSSSLKMSAAAAAADQQQRYSDPDQPARFAQAKAEQNQRYLDITSVYDASFLKGKRVAVTGANRGIGLALATELTEAGARVVAIVRSSSAELDALQPAEVVTGIDVTNDEQCASGMASQIKGGPIDIVRKPRHTWISRPANWKVCCSSLKALTRFRRAFSFLLSLFSSYLLAHKQTNKQTKQHSW